MLALASTAPAIEINNVNDLSVVSYVNVFNSRDIHKTPLGVGWVVCYFIRRKLVVEDYCDKKNVRIAK